MNDQRFEYDIQKRARAGVRATLRGAVALYIIYLGYQLVRDAAGPWQAAAGVFFIVAALAFGLYALRRWRLDLEAARLPETAEADPDDCPGGCEADDPGEDDDPEEDDDTDEDPEEDGDPEEDPDEADDLDEDEYETVDRDPGEDGYEDPEEGPYPESDADAEEAPLE